MEQNIQINMTRADLERKVREIARQRLEGILREQERKLSHDISNEILDRVHDLLDTQIRDLIRQKLNEEILPKVIDSFSDGIINGLIDKETVWPQVLYQMAEPNPEGSIARRPLKERIKGAKTLLITDPYFFTIPVELTDEKYVEQIFDVLPSATLKKLIIIYQEKNKSSALNSFKDNLPKNIELVLIKDDSIHDRIWMVDEKKAYVIGASFNGIGKKLAFINRLPKQDLIDFKAYLKELFAKQKVDQSSTIP